MEKALLAFRPLQPTAPGTKMSTMEREMQSQPMADSHSLGGDPGIWPAHRSKILDWLMTEARSERFIDNILVEMCERLMDADVPVSRCLCSGALGCFGNIRHYCAYQQTGASGIEEANFSN
jgi:hypothetical protein